MNLTKSKILSHLRGKISNAIVLDQISFTHSEWLKNKEIIFKNLKNKKWLNSKLIIRSSSLNEDDYKFSNAGKYKSFLNIKGIENTENAINEVFNSYENFNHNNEVFIQLMITNISLAGVVLTKDQNNMSPYFRIEYDDSTGKTDTVTSGKYEKNVSIIHRHYKKKFKDFRDNIISMCFELEKVLNHESLDIEFALDSKKKLYLLQVRKLIFHKSIIKNYSDKNHFKNINLLRNTFINWSSKHPFLFGNESIYSVMTDWNPAEIIGQRPKPFSLSFYREMITDQIWAIQRKNYGYRDLSGYPLIVEFGGIPYVDIRASFNSFVPKNLDKILSTKLVNYYIRKLKNRPELHDKVEFDVLFTCYDFNTKNKLKLLSNEKFSLKQISQIGNSLLELTNNIISKNEHFLDKELNHIELLNKNFEKIRKKNIDNFSKIFLLTQECKKYGTLPFAGLARLGFISISFLKSMLKEKLISSNEYDNFLQSINTVSKNLSKDFNMLSKKNFLLKYGHLRPGTYDINSSSYSESPNLYFNWKNKKIKFYKSKKFVISNENRNKIDKEIKKNKLKINSHDLFIFMKKSIEGREYSKFIFTKCISEIIKICKNIYPKNQISIEDASFTHFNSILSLNSSSYGSKNTILESINRRKSRYEFTKSISLPYLIKNADDFLYFNENIDSPNFITTKKVIGNVEIINKNNWFLKNKIIFIENADPGYDWIFSYKIIGLVTKFGGANSHMAIRANELQIPSVIGLGNNYEKYKLLKKIEINCLEKYLREI